jgi:hypothetical protein
MSSTTIRLQVQNLGGPYIPDTGAYRVGLKLIDSNKEPEQYWHYRYFATDLRFLERGDFFLPTITNFWFTRPEVDLIEVTFLPVDAESTTANNQHTRGVTVLAAKSSIGDCVSYLFDAVQAVGLASGVPVGTIDTITVHYLTAVAKITEYQDKGHWDKVWEAVVEFAVKGGLEVAETAKPESVFIDIVKYFGVTAWDAIHCADYVSDVILALVEDVNHKGIPINATYVESPIHVLVTTGSGARVGILDDGTIVNEIPDAEVLQAADGRKLILYPGRDTEAVELTGIGSGHFDLTLALAKSDGTTHSVRYRNVPVKPETVGMIDATDDDYALALDDDGDGTVDRVESPSDVTVSHPGAIYLPLLMKSYAPGPELSNHPPSLPSAPLPVDGAEDQDLNLTLTWTGGDPDGDAVTYDVYLEAGNSEPGILVCSEVTTTFCDPGALAYDTHLYWQVVATDEHGAATTGPVWDFQTMIAANRPPYTPSSPSPGDGTTEEGVDVNLGWTGGDPDGDLVTYDVYFESDDSTPDNLACNDAVSSSCDPGNLSHDTHYYWKVVARDEHGATATGPIWDFKTVGDWLRSIPAPPGTQPSGLAWDGSYLWMASYASWSETPGVYKLDPRDGSALKVCRPQPDERYSGLTYDGTYLWLANIWDRGIFKLRPSDCAHISTISGPGSDLNDLAWDGNHLWVTSYPSQKFYKIRPSDGSVVAEFDYPPGLDETQNTGLAYDGVSLWFSADGTIYKLNPANGQVISSMSTGITRPDSLAWDGTYLWIASFDEAMIYQIDVGAITNTE